MKKIEKLDWDKEISKGEGNLDAQARAMIQAIFFKQQEIIDRLEKQEQLNKTFSERLGLDPDDDRSKPDKECEHEWTEDSLSCFKCGKLRTTYTKPDKLQRLLEWVEGNFIIPQDDVTPICVSRIDLKAKIKELMDEE